MGYVSSGLLALAQTATALTITLVIVLAGHGTENYHDTATTTITHTMLSKKAMQLPQSKAKRRTLMSGKVARLRTKQTNATASLKNIKLLHSLQRWVHEVLHQLHPSIFIIPATVMQSLAIPHPSLHQLILRSSNVHRCFDPRALCRSVQSTPIAYARIHTTLKQYIQRKFGHSTSCPLHVIAKRHLDNAVRLIQSFIRCRLAVMLLASKRKYYRGLVQSPHLIVLGTSRRAAIVIQAFWRYTQSIHFWHPYVQVYRMRILVQANRLQHSRYLLAMTPHVKEIYPILLSKWFNMTPINPSNRTWFSRRPSIIAPSA